MSRASQKTLLGKKSSEPRNNSKEKAQLPIVNETPEKSLFSAQKYLNNTDQ